MYRFGLICLLALAACRTTTTSSPPNMDAAVVTHATPVFAWKFVDGGRTLGFVVRYATGEPRSQTWYSVRNEHNQELGLVDADGRAWRYRAHQRDPEWLGSGTVAQGAGRILAASAFAEMIATDVARLSENGANLRAP